MGTKKVFLMAEPKGPLQDDLRVAKKAVLMVALMDVLLAETMEAMAVMKVVKMVDNWVHS